MRSQPDRQTNWSSKNEGFAEGLPTVPRKIKNSNKDAQPWISADDIDGGRPRKG
jgi:hypothetical protein